MVSAVLPPSALETEALNWIVVDLVNKPEDYELKMLRAEFLLVSNIFHDQMDGRRNLKHNGEI